MSRFLSDEEENMESPDYRVNDILAEILDDMLPEAEQTSPPRRSLSRSSMDALRPAEEPEDSVRIYQPRRDRRESQDAQAAYNAWLFYRKTDAEEEEKEEAEE